MTVASVTSAPRSEAPGPQLLLRDNGPVAEAIGTLLGRVVRVPPVTLVAVAAAPLLGLIAVERDGASEAALGIALAWFVVLAGSTSRRADYGRFRWFTPAILRMTEYATLILLGAVAGGGGVPAVFALLSVLAFRHYDIVYRTRHQGMAAPAWVGAVALGWAGRLILAYVLLVLDVLPAGLFVFAGVLGFVLVTESAASWIRGARLADGDDVYEEEEDEGA